MPELPEVETVRRGLTNLVAGRTVESTEVRWEKTVGGFTAEEFDQALRNIYYLDLQVASPWCHIFAWRDHTIPYQLGQSQVNMI